MGTRTDKSFELPAADCEAVADAEAEVFIGGVDTAEIVGRSRVAVAGCDATIGIRGAIVDDIGRGEMFEFVGNIVRGEVVNLCVGNVW